MNCAGISQTTLLKRTPDPELEKILDTNLLAAILVCKYAKVQPNGINFATSHQTNSLTDSGCIINVSSLMATKGGLGASAYVASKAGLVGT